jgi:hypothetical protein
MEDNQDGKGGKDGKGGNDVFLAVEITFVTT